MTKLTKKHFEYFKKRCLYWQKEFGLTNFRLYFEWQDEEDTKASVIVSYSNRICTSYLNRRWNTKCNFKELNKSAFHEIQELLINDLITEARSMGLGDELLARLSHDIIRRWENYIFKK